MPSEVHVNITSNASGSQVIFHNPGQQPSHPNVGKPVVVTAKPAGQANGNAQGQIANTTVVFSNPG